MTALSWLAFCHDEWPGLTDSDVSTLLWQCTAFPNGDVDQIEREFVAIKARAGGCLQRALEMAADEVEGR